MPSSRGPNPERCARLPRAVKRVAQPALGLPQGVALHHPMRPIHVSHAHSTPKWRRLAPPRPPATAISSPPPLITRNISPTAVGKPRAWCGDTLAAASHATLCRCAVCVLNVGERRSLRWAPSHSAAAAGSQVLPAKRRAGSVASFDEMHARITRPS